MSEQGRFRNVEWFANLVGITRLSAYRLLKSGEGPPHLRIGRVIRLDQDIVEEWLASQQDPLNEETESPEEQDQDPALTQETDRVESLSERRAVLVDAIRALIIVRDGIRPLDRHGRQVAGKPGRLCQVIDGLQALLTE